MTARLPLFAPAFATLRPYFVLALIAFPGFLIFAFFLNGFDSGEHNGVFSICLFRDLTGLPCPGCGLTRALALLFLGDWRAALFLHPLSPFVFAGLLIVGVGAFWDLCARLLLRFHRGWFFAVFLVLLFGGGLLRMGLVALRPELAREFVYDFSRDRGPLSVIFERFSP